MAKEIVIQRPDDALLSAMSDGAFHAVRCDSRNVWLAQRLKSIGSSDAAAVMGMSPYMSETELWEKKRSSSMSESEENEDMRRGHASEPLLLSLYSVETGHGVLWGDGIILRSNRIPFMSATLDGIGVDPSTGEPYIIEVKSISRKGDDWTDESVPVHYYLQVLHQLSVTGWKKAILLARFCRTEWGGDSAYERCYHFDRADLEKEISSLEKVEEKFWNECVVGGMRPAVRVPEV